MAWPLFRLFAIPAFWVTGLHSTLFSTLPSFLAAAVASETKAEQNKPQSKSNEITGLSVTYLPAIFLSESQMRHGVYVWTSCANVALRAFHVVLTWHRSERLQ